MGNSGVKRSENTVHNICTLGVNVCIGTVENHLLGCSYPCQVYVRTGDLVAVNRYFL